MTLSLLFLNLEEEKNLMNGIFLHCSMFFLLNHSQVIAIKIKLDAS